MKEIPAYTPRWLSSFFAFLSRQRLPLWLLGLLIILFVGLIVHLDAWRLGLLPLGAFSLELAAEGLYWTVPPMMWISLDRRASLAVEGFYKKQGKSEEKLQNDVLDFLSLPSVAATIVFILGMVIGLLTYFTVGETGGLIVRVAPWEVIPNFTLSNGLFALFLFRALRQAVVMNRLFAGVKVDVFNPQPIFALSRYGSQSSLVILSMFYLLILLSTISNYETMLETLASPVFLVTQAILIGAAAFLFFMPLAGINRRMREEKDRLLSEFGINLEAMYSQANKAAERGDFARVGEMREPCVTLKEGWELVKKMPTWPWEPESLRNLLFPVFLPILVYLIQRFLEPLF